MSSTTEEVEAADRSTMLRRLDDFAEAREACIRLPNAQRKRELQFAVDSVERFFNSRYPEAHLQKQIAQLSATVSAQSAEIEELRRGWQPIETAPKDGTELIGRLSPTRFSLIYYFAPSAITNGWRNEMGSAVKPTHWMPLPPLKETN